MTETLTVGSAIKVVDEHYVTHDGLVTTIHGYPTIEARNEALNASDWYTTEPERLASAIAAPFTPPVINAVYVSIDPAKHDPYGQQLERLSSLQHESGTANMPRPGRYWATL